MDLEPKTSSPFRPNKKTIWGIIHGTKENIFLFHQPPPRRQNAIDSPYFSRPGGTCDNRNGSACGILSIAQSDPDFCSFALARFCAKVHKPRILNRAIVIV